MKGLCYDPDTKHRDAQYAFLYDFIRFPKNHGLLAIRVGPVCLFSMSCTLF